MTSTLSLVETDASLSEDFQEEYDTLLDELKAILAERPTELEELLTHLFKGHYIVFDKEVGILYDRMMDVEGIVLDVIKGLACVHAAHDGNRVNQEVGRRIMERRDTYRAFREFTQKWAEFVEAHGGQHKLGYLAKHERFLTGV